MIARVLIVDDDELMLSSLELELEDAGYQVATASSGPAAIELAGRQQFDLVLTDIRMPGMDGLDALGQVKRHLPKARTIVMTGYASPDAPITALKLRVDDYLLKPFDTEVLLASIAAALGHLQSASAQNPGSGEPILQLLSSVLKRSEEAERVAQEAARLGGALGFGGSRLRKVYLAGLLSGVEAEVLAEFPGLRVSLTLLRGSQNWWSGESELEGREIPLESRLLAVACCPDPEQLKAEAGTRYDPELVELALDESQMAVPLDDSIGLDNLRRLANKHREMGHLSTAQKVYEQLERLASNDAQFLAEARLGKVKVLWAQDDAEGALAEVRAVVQHCRDKELALLGAEAVVQAARMGEDVPEDLDWAKKTYELWEDESGLASVSLFQASFGGPREAKAWMEGRGFATTLELFPEVAAQILAQRILDPRTSQAAEAAVESAPSVRGKVDELLGRATPSEEVAEPTLLEISLLGSFQVRLGEQSLSEDDWPTRKDKELFCYLVAHHGQPVHEERLMDLFWRRSGKKGRHSLHNSISQTRKTLARLLGPLAKGAIKKKREGYVFGVGVECRVDLAEFESEFERGLECSEAGQWSAAVGHLQRAEKLGSGEFLAGSYEDWGIDLRLRLEQKLVNCRVLLAQHFGGKGKTVVSAKLWERVLSLDNCHEQAYFELMRAQISLGRQSAAVKTYQRCQKALQQELDLPPPAEVTALYESLVT